MNYTSTDLPNSGTYPIVHMDIMLKEECLGRIYIRLDRTVFPAGVENFVRIAAGSTYHFEKQTGYIREVKRTYENCQFFRCLYGNYIVSGDIYNNNGSRAGTIYYDKPIEYCPGTNLRYPHDTAGLISLVPFLDEATGSLFYDSTFMITLDNVKPTNTLAALDVDQIVIGRIYEGLDTIRKINELIRPFAGRRYPSFKIGECGAHYLSQPLGT